MDYVKEVVILEDLFKCLSRDENDSLFIILRHVNDFFEDVLCLRNDNDQINVNDVV